MAVWRLFRELHSVHSSTILILARRSCPFIMEHIRTSENTAGDQNSAKRSAHFRLASHQNMPRPHGEGDYGLQHNRFLRTGSSAARTKELIAACKAKALDPREDDQAPAEDKDEAEALEQSDFGSSTAVPSDGGVA